MVNIQLFKGFHTSQVVSQIFFIYSTFSRDPHSHVEGYNRDLYYTFPILFPYFPWNSLWEQLWVAGGVPILAWVLGIPLEQIVLGVWFFGLPNIFTNSWLSRGWKVIVDRGDCCHCFCGFSNWKALFVFLFFQLTYRKRLQGPSFLVIWSWSSSTFNNQYTSIHSNISSDDKQRIGIFWVHQRPT